MVKATSPLASPSLWRSTRTGSPAISICFTTRQKPSRASWDLDRTLLEAAGYTVDPLRERPGFVEATVSRGGQRLLVEWARDSAYRFFPLVAHEELGLMLHAFDLATNKVLALSVVSRSATGWM